jgi:hypothetical protein
VRYLLLICVDPTLERDEKPGDIDVWLERVGDKRVIGEALHPARTAATVRVRRSERLVTDGPFAETKELIAGFDVIDADSLEEAVDIAAGHPVAKFGAVEVREFWSQD